MSLESIDDQILQDAVQRAGLQDVPAPTDAASEAGNVQPAPAGAPRILSAKAGYFDKEQVFVAEFDALESQKQELQGQIQREQDEANRKFTLKVTPLQEKIAGIEDAQKKLHAAFVAWSQEQRARIAVLGETANGDSRD